MCRKNSWMVCFLGVMFVAGVTECQAQLGSRKADEWVTTLEGEHRVAAQKIEEVLARLSLRSGAVVADIGAGSGLFSRALAKAVAPAGKVYAVDIQQGLLNYINQRNKEEHIRNIHTILGEFNDPHLPVQDVDLAFINDVLHHIENRAPYLKALARYIKPNGRIVIIDMNNNDPNTPHKNQPELLVTREEILHWMSDAGFKLVEEYPDTFPGKKWFFVFGR